MQYRTKTLKNIKNSSGLIFILTLFTLTMSAQMSKIDGVDVVVGKNVEALQRMSRENGLFLKDYNNFTKHLGEWLI